MTTSRSLLTGAVVAICLAGVTSAPAVAAPTTYTYSVSDSTLAGADRAVLAFDPASRTAYAAESDPDQKTLTVIDQATNTVTATISASNGETGLAVDSGTHTVYLPDATGGAVRIIDGTTHIIRATVDMYSPWAAAVDPGTHRAFVTDIDEETVKVIDGDTDSVVATVPVGHLPFELAVDPTRHEVYVASYESNSVSVIDEDTSSVTATIPVGTRPGSVAVDPKAQKAYVTNNGSDTVSVIDTATKTVARTIGVGTRPTDVDVDPATSTAYVVNGGDDTVSVIDTRTDAVTNTLAVGDAAGDDPASEVYVDPAAHTAYVWFLGRRTNQKITQTPVANRPGVTGLSPSSGPTTGGQQVVITGSGFTTARKVSFGQTPAQSYTIDSDTQITAVAPAHSAGTVQVRVKSKGLSARTQSSRYRYTSASR